MEVHVASVIAPFWPISCEALCITSCDVEDSIIEVIYQCRFFRRTWNQRVRSWCRELGGEGGYHRCLWRRWRHQTWLCTSLSHVCFSCVDMQNTFQSDQSISRCVLRVERDKVLNRLWFWIAPLITKLSDSTTIQSYHINRRPLRWVLIARLSTTI